MLKTGPRLIAEMDSLWRKDLNGYTEAAQTNKDRAHFLASAILRDLAKNGLGLDKSQFEVRSNQAGPAISGEVTLHTDIFAPKGGIYIQIGSPIADDKNVLYRSCTGRKDYTGGRNNWTSIRYAFGSDEQVRGFVAVLRSLITPLDLD